MLKFINRIEGNLPYTEKNICIDAGGKNIILTGSNGCGKTSFITQIKNKIHLHCIDRKLSMKETIQKHITHFESEIKKHQRGTMQHTNAIQKLNAAQGEYDNIFNGIQISYSDANEFSALLAERKAIFSYFGASRQAKIEYAGGATRVATINNSHTNRDADDGSGNLFEQHLVNLKTRQSFAKTHDHDLELYNSIDEWFQMLEENISYLMEDDSFELIFDSNEFKFFLTQKGKSKYTLQTLSSGYSSIFSIISNLIMSAETYSISPKNIQGVVLVDEIDAHLHVSLQRKILPFLTQTYPAVQFIVTTHSPFVIGSLADSIVYDLSTQQQFEDLSNYSYEVIVEGLLRVPVVSISLENDVKQLSKLLNEDNKNLDVIKEIVDKLGPHEKKLDDEAAVFLLKARKIIIDYKEGA